MLCQHVCERIQCQILSAMSDLMKEEGLRDCVGLINSCD